MLGDKQLLDRQVMLSIFGLNKRDSEKERERERKKERKTN